VEKHCPECGRLYFHSLNGVGCLTLGCPHSLIRREPPKKKKAAPPNPPKEEKS
jgi:hypothetical protein